jgi:amino-acid N-acetyltransferase
MNNDITAFVQWFRSAAPYINGFRGKTFVVAFGGEVVTEGQFVGLAQDINLLSSLGVRLVLVHGARPQIEAQLKERGAVIHYENGLRVTDAAALASVKEAVGTVRVEIEALLSLGLANTPMAGSDIRVASGNFVTAKPLGVRDGVDLQHTGAVRKIHSEAINKRLEDGEIVLLSPIGYSPTGEIFNVTVESVAAEAAIALHADKLVYLMETDGVPASRGRTLSTLTVEEAEAWLAKARKIPEDVGYFLPSAIKACKEGAKRAHLISRHRDGALLAELFTRDGVGTLVTPSPLETLRAATIDDVGDILGLIEPLEREGVLVRRSRELLEMEIDRFQIVESDGVVAGCVAVYPFAQEKLAEMACLVVHPGYRKHGLGDRLREAAERSAVKLGARQVFVLTTQAEQWFEERGYVEVSLAQLPAGRQKLYNYQRRSKVLIKKIN